ncbi:MAG TPA: transcriptional regulator, partial [Thermoanaerobacter sp.]|nr:transcriptional regulator [Thermoanaerobacter sp.]
DKGRGVLLLVDMGSLVLFGDMIYERTGIPVKTIEMVSTPMVLEAARKAILNASLDEVYDAVVNFSPYVGRIYKESVKIEDSLKKNVIITACITGEGTAVKLKSILEKNLDLKEKDIDVIPIEIESKKEFRRKLLNIKEEKNILAVVSAINPEDDSVLYISTSDVFDNDKLSVLRNKIEALSQIEIIDNMKEVIRENIKIDSEKYISSFKRFYAALIRDGVNLNEDITIGLILHLACVIERILQGKQLIHIKDTQEYIKNYPKEFDIIKKAIRIIEEGCNVKISDEECVNMMKIIYSL